MQFLSRSSLLLPAVLLVSSAAFGASTISGTVTNRTTNKPSAGDTVTLVRLAQGMQDSTQTKTDAKGHYTLDVPDAGIHLVRVTHDLANYFQPAPPGTEAVDLDVYNAAAHVKGVSTEADVVRMETNAAGNTLQVVEHFFIKNDSKPQMTQFSRDPFDFYLPDGAVIEGSAAQAPNGMPVHAAPVPLAEKNHFTFLFPIRPGETQFQVTYHLAYGGEINLVPKLTSTVGAFVVMLPKGITFTPVPGSPYAPVEEEPNAQTFLARNVTPGTPISYTLNGAGQLPRDSQSPDGGAQGGPAAAGAGSTIPATENTTPGKGLDNPLDPSGTRDPWAKYKWWILSGLLLLLAIAAGVLLRKPTDAFGGPSRNGLPLSEDERTLLAIKDEIFVLETERLQGRISEEDYLAHKLALDAVLKRALTRQAVARSGDTGTV